MPIYEYRCEGCGERTEVLQKLNDRPLRKCAECGGRLRKMVSAPSFQFKGSGWYVTDYAGKKGGEDGGAGQDKDKDSAADAKPAEPATGDGAKAGDSKPAAEASPKETKPKGGKPAVTSKETTGRSGKPTPAAS